MTTLNTTSRTVETFREAVGPEAISTELLNSVGWEELEKRSATTITVDHSYSTMDSQDSNVIVMSLSEALVTYPSVQRTHVQPHQLGRR